VSRDIHWHTLQSPWHSQPYSCCCRFYHPHHRQG